MPVEFAGEAPRVFNLPSAVPVRVELSSSRIVPVLMLADRPVAVGQQSFVPLEAQQKLVVVVGGNADRPDAIFPHDKTVIVHRASLPTDPSLAWDAVDALVIDRPLPPQIRDRLLAQGTTLVVRAPERPDSAMPWCSFGSGWILRSIAPDLVSDVSSIYEPTISWMPSPSRSQRQMLLGISTLAALAGLATLLIRSRWRIGLQAAVFGGMIVGLALWYHATPPLHGQIVRVDLFRDGFRQRDDWIYYKAAHSAATTSYGKPIVLDGAYAQRCKLTEDFKSDDDVQWSFELQPNQALATVQRNATAMTSVPTTHLPVIQSAMTTMAKNVYARAGSIVSEGHSTDEPTFTHIVVSDP